MGHLKWLDSLDLQSNRLVGTIPSEMGLLSNLEYLALNNNKLEGEIPRTFANLKRTEQILLQFNDLTGVISEEICTLRDDLDLWNFVTDCLPIAEADISPITCDCCSLCCDGIAHCALPPE